MKYFILGTAALLAVSCANDQRNKWDGIQREEEIQRQEDEQREEATRTSERSDDIGPGYDHGSTASPAYD